MKLTEQKVSILSITEEKSKEELFLNFVEMMKLSQIYMDYLMLQIFYSYRSLEIQQFKNYSDKISYHFGYFHPDLESDCKEFNDEISRSKLFEAYNKSWTDIGKSVINAQNEFDSFSKSGNWSNYTMRLSLNDALLKRYIDNPLSEKLTFTIDESNVEFINKRYIRIQAVKISFVNAILKSGNSQFNAILHQSGKVSQNTEPNIFKSALLEGLTTGIPDVETKELGNNDFEGAIGVIGFNVGFKLSYRPIYSSYEISIEPSEISKIDLSSVSKVQVWFKCVYRD